MPPTIRKMLDLSTAHLPARFFEPGCDLSGADLTESGMLLWVAADPAADAAPGASEDDRAPEVLAVRRYARAQGCDYILFDVNAGVCPDLPTWEW